MTPEATDYLGKARQCLESARAILAIKESNDAGRAAHLAAFHAAQAFIFEGTGKIAKTHRGLHSEFARLAFFGQNRKARKTTACAACKPS